jgi:hypothetical protein
MKVLEYSPSRFDQSRAMTIPAYALVEVKDGSRRLMTNDPSRLRELYDTSVPIQYATNALLAGLASTLEVER